MSGQALVISSVADGASRAALADALALTTADGVGAGAGGREASVPPGPGPIRPTLTGALVGFVLVGEVGALAADALSAGVAESFDLKSEQLTTAVNATQTSAAK